MQNLKNKLAISLLLPTMIYASSRLDIYTNGAFYYYTPQDTYIGFTSEVEVLCGSRELHLRASSCPSDKRLCQAKEKLETLYAKSLGIAEESKTLDRLLSLTQPQMIDALAWIDWVHLIAEKKAKLILQSENLKERLTQEGEDFQAQAPSLKAYETKELCDKEIKIEIPQGAIGTKFLYQAELHPLQKSITLKHSVALTNRSGIDIVASYANLYAKSSNLWLQPLHFLPWIAQVESDYPKERQAKMVFAELSPPAPAPMMMSPKIKEVVETGFKTYAIGEVVLPSTGEAINVDVWTYEAPLTCELISYPYSDTRLYEACTFQPQKPIEASEWTILQGESVISKSAKGEYQKGKYLLYTGVDETVIIKHQKSIKNDTSSGIFGGSIKKTDGFTLEIENISSEPKVLKIIERIPKSTTSQIEVKLLSLKGVERYTVDTQGEVTMNLSLKPKEHKTVTLSFELSYDKDLKVNY